jgi:hypothetical protein
MSLKYVFQRNRGRALAWLLGSPLLALVLAACGNNGGSGPGY